ncbi:hypothetical protein J7I94_06705 [Streptomyces sp. ISL-12]|uniref:hypothetical protein n=1 Tax=Streptomyces sp. ISL-12 TaxID=2819177 RepID=UPI001BE63D3A|nr:hypothetical protein [Streptomyces sp. ISL-12]MBT2410249.1 hypothetical protein [Streptomyces sp. ISL-12]
MTAPDRPARPADFTNVHDFLHEVRRRPAMWVPGGSLQHLHSMLTGYRTALETHDITEPSPFWPSTGTEAPFTTWLHTRLDRNSSLTWATEIEREAEATGVPAMGLFFTFLDEYLAADQPGAG